MRKSDADSGWMVGGNLRLLLHAWDEVQKRLGITRLQAANFVEEIFHRQGLTLFLDAPHMGLWRPVEGSIKNLISDVSSSDYAKGIDDDMNGWTAWRLTQEDFDRIVSAADAVTGRSLGALKDQTAGTEPRAPNAAASNGLPAKANLLNYLVTRGIDLAVIRKEASDSYYGPIAQLLLESDRVVERANAP